MVNKNRDFIRGECENCGAPLSRAKQKGKYVCQYCGAVYYDNSFSGNDWEADVEIPEIPEKSQTDTIIQPPIIPKKKSKFNLIKVIGIGFIAIICMIVVIVTGESNGSKTNPSKNNQAIKKPAMLNQLPQAAKAGTSIAYANWELTISPEIDVDDNRIAFNMVLKNWNNNQQTFRYKPNTIVVYDDLGNTYQFFIGNCEPDIPYLDRQITFEPYEEVEFESKRSWCSRAYNLPLYSGVIPQEAKKIYFHLEQFGVYQNITFVIDL